MYHTMIYARLCRCILACQHAARKLGPADLSHPAPDGLSEALYAAIPSRYVMKRPAASYTCFELVSELGAVCTELARRPSLVPADADPRFTAGADAYAGLIVALRLARAQAASRALDELAGALAQFIHAARAYQHSLAQVGLIADGRCPQRPGPQGVAQLAARARLYGLALAADFLASLDAGAPVRSSLNPEPEVVEDFRARYADQIADFVHDDLYAELQSLAIERCADDSSLAYADAHTQQMEALYRTSFGLGVPNSGGGGRV